MANAGYPELSGWFQTAKRFIYESLDQFASQSGILADDDDSGNSSRGHGIDRDKPSENKRRQGQPLDEPTGQVEDMVDTISGGAQESYAGRQSGKQQRDFPSEEVADSNAERLQGDGRTGEETYDERSRHVPLYPPGPDDYEGWTHVLTDVPSLEPTFCRVAHGSTPWVDKQLRSIGNGVVPASAARAFLLLSRRFE
jgi:hypothetical protein